MLHHTENFFLKTKKAVVTITVERSSSRNINYYKGARKLAKHLLNKVSWLHYSYYCNTEG